MINLLLLPTDDPNVCDIADVQDEQFPVAAPLYWLSVDLDRPAYYQRKWSTRLHCYLGSKPAPDYDVVPVFEF
jgi:hypothetical protein